MVTTHSRLCARSLTHNQGLQESQGYPNVPLGAGFQIDAQELGLLGAVTDACPKNTKVDVLPSS